MQLLNKESKRGNIMEIVMIKCPYCERSYLATVENHTEPCPICGKLVIVEIIPKKIIVKTQEE
jgi:endogenous inhibitor of DNA gyrase (YacG/DUF329 family)